MTRSRLFLASLLLPVCLAAAVDSPVDTQVDTLVDSPKQFLGFNIGDDYQVASYSQLEAYWKKLATQSDRMKLVDIGKTAEGRTQYMAIISAPANLKNLARYQGISRKLAHAEGVSEPEARLLAREGKSIVWIDGGLHANETVGAQQLIETVYQLLSRTDVDTMRFLNDDIILCVQANPDGQELVANWYMREPDPLKRSLDRLPKLYNKYVGHDDNRDFYMSNMPETTSMNRQMFLEWFPQIVYDHHQTGPAGAVIFMPPFRDPFNFNLDPLIPLGIEMVGAAMHAGLVAEGKGGSAMRSGANYSTWWNGGLRTIAYFHNMIGLLTEIIGNPTPIEIALVPSKQLPTGDWPLPIAPGKWHYRQSIDYDVTNNRSVLDIASRYRETFLFNAWRMGMNSIEKGSRDSWTVTPKRIAALEIAVKVNNAPGLYERVLHDPAHRDPRGYVIPSDQADFPTATKFVNALLKNGVTVLKASSDFDVAGKHYAAGAFVVKTAQAFRPHVLDMFEPQDHPNDFRVPGGPPSAPYDITGWTLAMQMGVRFDRIMDGFDGPFVRMEGLQQPAPVRVTGAAAPAGYLISHRVNDSFLLINRLLKAQCEVYWLKQAFMAEGEDLGTGAIWVPASDAARAILDAGAKQLGVRVHAVAAMPGGDKVRVSPVRIALYDQYGGLVSSGWTRWLLEQFEFPFEVVYPETLDAGALRSRFDTILLTDGAYGNRTSLVSREKSLPELKRFVELGGELITIGGSSRLGELMGVPVRNALAGLTAEQFYIPGSLLRVRVDNTQPVAYGMGDYADVFYENSPVFQTEKGVARFEGREVLTSGWAWGQEHLEGGTAIVDAKVGEGRVVLLGPEVVFRGQPHGTFKFLFNALYSLR